MTRRKQFSIFLLLALVGSLCLSACGEKKPTVEPAPETYTLQLDYEETRGSITSDDLKGSYSMGDTLNLTISAKDGFILGEVTVNGAAAILEEGKLTLTIEGDTKVKADFRPIPKTVTLTHDNNKGTVSGIDTGSYALGSVLSFTVTPADPDGWARVSLNGSPLNPEDGIYTFTLEEDCTLEVFYYSPATRGDDPEMQRRQQLAVDEMFKIVATTFVYDKDYTYTLHGKPYTLKKGILYRGMPYSNYANNTLSSFLTASTGKDGDNYTIGDLQNNWEYILGNNCADTVYWAWSTVSDSFDYFYARMMTEAHGCLKVGEYEYATTEGFLVNTYADCKKNGLDVMAKAYALLQPGDAAVYYVGTSGHTILITEVHVERDANGKVDPNASWITYHDQNGTYKYRTYNGVEALTCCNVNARISFKQLFDRNYLPVTCAELLYGYEEVNPAVVTDSMAGSLTKDSLLEGTISSNFYMSYFTMEILNEAGDTVQSAVRYNQETTDNKKFEMNCFGTPVQVDGYGGDVYKTTIDPSLLPAGNYHCKVTAYIGNGETVVVRDFDFTV